MKDAQDNGQFHLVRVEENDLVLGDNPHGIDSEWIRILPIMSACMEVSHVIEIGGPRSSSIRASSEISIWNEHGAFHATFTNQVFFSRTAFALVINDKSRTEYVECLCEKIVVNETGVD